jgi:hypothetical protein
MLVVGAVTSPLEHSMRLVRSLLFTGFLIAPVIAYAATPAALRAACGADARKFCSAVISQEGPRRACMRKNFAKLSEACRTATKKLMPAPPGTTAATRAACGADARKLCRAVLFKTEARRACMRKNFVQLSESCKKSITAAKGKGKT